jgi:hypothetical protein
VHHLPEGAHALPAVLRARRRERVRAAGGDPARGRELLLGGDYMTCGVPYKVWGLGKDLVAGGYGGSADAPRIADRPGRNADMPYF